MTNRIHNTDAPSQRTKEFVVKAALMLSLLPVLSVVAGCTVYPKMPRRTINELYFEAVAASQNTPENTLGLNPSAKTVILPPVDISSPVIIPNPSETQSDLPLLVPVPDNNVTTKTTDDNNDGDLKPNSWRPSGTVPESRLTPVAYSPTVGTSAPTVTEIFEDTDVRQALQSLASQAEVSLIIDEQVGGVVSALIEDEPFETALRKLTIPLGLVYRKQSDQEYMVGVADPSSPMFSQLAERIEFHPEHLGPEELASLVSERHRQFLQVIDKRNRIIIEAPPEIASEILERLEESDQPIPQVELEAIVCVIAPDRGFKSGLDWGHAVTMNGSDILNLGMTGLALNGAASGMGINNALSDFAVTSTFVKLLAQEGYLSIRAAPRVTARDGDQARISITRESFFSTQPQSDNQFFRQEIETVQAGIELDITPVIRGDNITVKIEKAEVSEDIRTSTINSEITENPFPQINRRSVSTTVHVKDGETVVIGGLVQRQTVDRIARLPVIGAVPGLGRFFQTVEQTEQDAEVVIFISPRLVNTTCDPSR